MIRVYCDKITPRHRYIFDYFLEDVVGIKHSLTDDREDFLRSDGPKFWYGNDAPAGSLVITPLGLLSETGIRQLDPLVSHFDGLPVIFSSPEPPDLPFDPFAIVFYLVTRYEEYLPYKADGHGRFPASESIAAKGGFLDIPLVDLVGKGFRAWLEGHFPGIQFVKPPARFLPTFDIDIAFAHLGKGLPRATAAWLKLILSGKWGDVLERWHTLTGKAGDPYDNFLWLQEMSVQYGYNPIFFVLVGDFGKYDRNVSHRNPRFRKLLEQLSRNSEIGIHPSYRSFLDTGKIIQEKQRLEDILGKEVTRSRFHFLRMKFPASFQLLSECGIKDDHSIGYSTVNGYRAGTFTPFSYYDLDRERKSELKLHPFVFMDSAMIDNLSMTPGEALSSISEYIRQAKELSGELSGTWHNYALSEKNQYKGWRKVLDYVFKEFNNPAL